MNARIHMLIKGGNGLSSAVLFPDVNFKRLSGRWTLQSKESRGTAS